MKYWTIVLLLLLQVTISSGQAIVWQNMSGFTGLRSLSEGKDNTLYGVTSLYLYHSFDEGMSWVKDSIPYYGTITEFISNNKTLVLSKYLGGYWNNTYVYMSTDNGKTWPPIVIARDTYSNFMLSDDGTVYALNTQDDGNAIVRFNGTIWDTLGSTVWANAAIIDHEGNFIAEGISGGIYISKDSGSSWTKYFDGRSCVALNVNSANTIILGIDPSSTYSADGGIYISTNSGVSWDDLGFNDHSILKVVADNLGNYFVLTPDGLYRYNQKFETWINISPVSQLYSDLLSTTQGVLLSISDISKVLYRSSNSGDDWSPTAIHEAKIFSLHTTSTGAILAGTLGSGIFKMLNGKTNWYSASYGSLGKNVYAIEHNDSIAFACTDEGLCRSFDDGETWDNITSSFFGGSVYDVTFGDDGSFVVGSNFGVYVSSDHGGHWGAATLQNVKVFFLAKSPDGTIYAATESDGIFRSVDNGYSWDSRGAIRNDIEALEVHPNGDLYIGIYGGILKSVDQGQSWISSAFTNTYVNAIAFNGGPDIIVGTYNGIYRSLNAGASWATAGLSGSLILALGFDNRHSILAGIYGGGVYSSTQPLTSVDPDIQGLPISTELFQNYPNPFNPRTEICFQTAHHGHVRLTVIDILGREIETLADGWMPAGVSSVSWDASRYASGIYFYKLTAGENMSLVKKMILMK
jgi:photosystem II stability/assembly factor-like uncharacterized protein